MVRVTVAHVHTRSELTILKLPRQTASFSQSMQGSAGLQPLPVKPMNHLDYWGPNVCPDPGWAFTFPFMHTWAPALNLSASFHLLTRDFRHKHHMPILST